MHLIRYIFIGCLLFVMAGCASQPNPVGQVSLDKDLTYTLPEVPWIGSPLTSFQQVTLEYGGRVQHFQAVVALQAGKAHIALLDMAGRRAMDIRWSESDLKIKSADWLPQSAKPEEILSRLVLTFWPVEAATLGFSYPYILEEVGNVRWVKKGQEIIIKITRNGDDPWTSRNIMEHKNSDFRLTVSSSIRGVEE